MAKAAESYEKQRFDAAALEFEGLWREFKDPRFLFNAAVSRVAARHHAHAVAYLNEYLAGPGLTPEDRAEAEAQRAASLRETTSVMVQIDAPLELAALEFTVQHVPALASDIRPPLVFQAAGEGTPRARGVDLDAGEWKVKVQAPGFEAAEQTAIVAAGQPLTVRLALRPAPAASSGPGEVPAPVAGLPEGVRRSFVRAGAAGGGALALGGIGVLVAGQLGFGRVFRQTPDVCRPEEVDCRGDLAGKALLRSVGAGLLGVGVGVMASGLSGLSGQRKKVWLAEAAVGGVAAIGGAVWTVVAVGRVSTGNSRLDVGWDDAANQEAVKRSAGGYTAASAVLGLGAGLAVGGFTGLLLERAYAKGTPRAAAWRRRGLAASGAAAPGWAGVSVSGRF